MKAESERASLESLRPHPAPRLKGEKKYKIATRDETRRHAARVEAAGWLAPWRPEKETDADYSVHSCFSPP